MTTYTPEELDRARGEEAARIHGLKGILVAGSDLGAAYRHDVSATAARLARENWQPPPKVDPDVLAAREWFKGEAGWETVDTGRYDSTGLIRAWAAGAKHTREAERAKVMAVLDEVFDEVYNSERTIALIRKKLEGL
jgi:hypothetical protein